MSFSSLKNLFNVLSDTTEEDISSSERSLGSLHEVLEVRGVYLEILAGIIGQYVTIKTDLFDLSDVLAKENYERLINNPAVKVLKEESNFITNKVKTGDEVIQYPGYLVVVKYRITDFKIVFDSMSKYMDKLENLDPPMSSAGGFIDVMRAWEYFGMEVPPLEQPLHASLKERMDLFFKELQSRIEMPSAEDTLFGGGVTKNRLVITETIDETNTLQEDFREVNARTNKKTKTSPKRTPSKAKTTKNKKESQEVLTELLSNSDKDL